MDFPLEVSFTDNNNLEVKKEFKLLGVMITDDLKWEKNTEYICTKAMKKMWVFRSMKVAGLSMAELIDGYKKRSKVYS